MMKEQHRASRPALFLFLYGEEGKRRDRFPPHTIQSDRCGASGRRKKGLWTVGYHVSATEGPSNRKTWCFRTKKQGFAGGGAPRLCRRKPIQSERRGASGRRNKGLQAVEHHVSAGEGPSNLKDVVSLNEETRVCGQWGTTSRPPEACRPPPLAN